jgi:hypothetical protein
MAMQDIIVPHLTSYDYGIGVDRLTGSAKNLAVSQKQTTALDAGGAIQQFEVARISSTQDLQEHLGIDVSASYGCAAFGAGVSGRFDFARDSHVHAAALFMTVTSTIHLVDESINEPVLTPAAQAMVDNPNVFAQRYGDMFARACRRGGLFVGLMRIETTDEAEATSIEADLKGSYGLFSADASTKFGSIAENHHASVYCRIYAEGGPAIQLDDPNDPMKLLAAANGWLKAMHDDPKTNSRPYEWTLAPLAIAEGPLPPNAVDVEHAQDVLTFCAQERTKLFDQLNLLSWWLEHRNQYDWAGSSIDAVAAAVSATETDLDTIAACASNAINHPEGAPMPADFAATRGGKYRASAPLPKAPTALPGVAGVWQHTTTYRGQNYTSRWSLTPTGTGVYTAQETGLGNASGSAVLKGSHLQVSWATSSEQGTYDWDLDPAFTQGDGVLAFIAGSRTGTTSTASHVVRIPNAPPGSG